MAKAFLISLVVEINLFFSRLYGHLFVNRRSF
jgi:hypothetical protein